MFSKLAKGAQTEVQSSDKKKKRNEDVVEPEVKPINAHNIT